MILKYFFDIFTGFRFLEISVECPVHICSLSLAKASHAAWWEAAAQEDEKQQQLAEE